MMKNVSLGHLSVSQIGLGCMGMSWGYGERNDEESLATLDEAIALGMTFWDTAEMYGPYENELLIGRALKRHAGRDRVVIATKFGFRFVNGQIVGLDSRPENVKSVCDAALKRLGIDVIDLFYQHRVDKEVPIEETVGAMADLVKAGKVRYLGLSEASPSTIRRAHKVHQITALQSEYSLWERGVEKEILPLCRELGIGFVAYSPLGRGFLTGQAQRAEQYGERDSRRRQPRFYAENFDRNMKLVHTLEVLGRKKGATPAQLCIAWLLAQSERDGFPSIVPIPGTKQRRYLRENAKASKLVFSDEELAYLGAEFYPGVSAGKRFEGVPETWLDP